MKPTNAQYSSKVDKRSPNSPILKNMSLAFLVGGAICVIGQLIFNMYQSFGLDDDKAGIATPVTMVFLGALFTGLRVYDKLAKFAGAGTVVPITGFANAVVAPALEYKSEGYVLGMGAKMFTVAGPVIVFGTVSSVIYGLILCLIY